MDYTVVFPPTKREGVRLWEGLSSLPAPSSFLCFPQRSGPQGWLILKTEILSSPEELAAYQGWAEVTSEWEYHVEESFWFWSFCMLISPLKYQVLEVRSESKCSSCYHGSPGDSALWTPSFADSLVRGLPRGHILLPIFTIGQDVPWNKWLHFSKPLFKL